MQFTWLFVGTLIGLLPSYILAIEGADIAGSIVVLRMPPRELQSS